MRVSSLANFSNLHHFYPDNLDKFFSFEKHIPISLGNQLSIYPLFPFPQSEGKTNPMTLDLSLTLLNIKFWDTKDIAGPYSVISLFPWFLPCIIPIILFVRILFILTILWQLHSNIINKPLLLITGWAAGLLSLVIQEHWRKFLNT